MKVFYFSPAILVDLFKSGALDGVRCVTPLPDDAQLDRVFLDYAYSTPRIGLVITSVTYDPLEEGSLIPEERLMFDKVTP